MGLLLPIFISKFIEVWPIIKALQKIDIPKPLKKYPFFYEFFFRKINIS
jgi:hypothetical protein